MTSSSLIVGGTSAVKRPNGRGRMDEPRKHTCAFCEYFEGGGPSLVEAVRASGDSLPGDCRNIYSSRFTTYSIDSCNEFQLDSQLWYEVEVNE